MNTAGRMKHRPEPKRQVHEFNLPGVGGLGAKRRRERRHGRGLKLACVERLLLPQGRHSGQPLQRVYHREGPRSTIERSAADSSSSAARPVPMTPCRRSRIRTVPFNPTPTTPMPIVMKPARDHMAQDLPSSCHVVAGRCAIRHPRGRVADRIHPARASDVAHPSWSHLKGVDARCVSLLRAAAERARCEATLALIDIHETWSAFEPESRHHSHRSYRRWADWDDEDDDPDADSTDQVDAGDYDLDEMIESVITLDSWLGSPNGTVQKVGLTIGDDELCASTATEDMTPYASEYEGYMGNWGNTLDRWYHRGAVVIWPRRLDFAVHAEASPSWALGSLAARARRGDVAEARTDAATLSAFWERVVRRVEAKGLITKAMRTACLVDDPSSATMLLNPFRMELLTPRHAKALSALEDAYGEQWMATLVEAWSSRGRRFSRLESSTTQWITSMQGLCERLVDEGDPGRSVAVLLVRDSWSCLRTMIEQALGVPLPSHRETAFAELGSALGALVDGASMVGAADIIGEVSGFLCRGDDALADCAMQVLRATPAQRWGAAGLDTVANHRLEALEERLARPPRRVDDWSIDLPPGGCHCDLCGALAGFLADQSLRILEWPLASERRSHAHSRIAGAELPVSHETRRQGRPYTLVLTKTSVLFQRDKRAHLRDKADRAWIRRTQWSRPKRR